LYLLHDRNLQSIQFERFALRNSEIGLSEALWHDAYQNSRVLGTGNGGRPLKSGLVVKVLHGFGYIFDVVGFGARSKGTTISGAEGDLEIPWFAFCVDDADLNSEGNQQRDTLKLRCSTEWPEEILKGR
jgi:hypothetical protein